MFTYNSNDEETVERCQAGTLVDALRMRSDMTHQNRGGSFLNDHIIELVRKVLYALFFLFIFNTHLSY